MSFEDFDSPWQNVGPEQQMHPSMQTGRQPQQPTGWPSQPQPAWGAQPQQPTGWPSQPQPSWGAQPQQHATYILAPPPLDPIALEKLKTDLVMRWSELNSTLRRLRSIQELQQKEVIYLKELIDILTDEYNNPTIQQPNNPGGKEDNFKF